MRRFLRKALCILMGGCLLWMPSTLSFGGELIEPTRVLEGENRQSGKLSVFSEPPGFEVRLDGKAIGKTPLSLKTVSIGAHVLQVENKETIINISIGESRRLSFFKGEFVEIPAEAKVTREEPKPVEEKPAAHVSGSEQSAGSRLEGNPRYFPLNPGGHIVR